MAKPIKSILLCTALIAVFSIGYTPAAQATPASDCWAEAFKPTKVNFAGVVDSVSGWGEGECRFRMDHLTLTVKIQKHSWWFVWNDLGHAVYEDNDWHFIRGETSVLCEDGTWTYRTAADFEWGDGLHVHLKTDVSDTNPIRCDNDDQENPDELPPCGIPRDPPDAGYLACSTR